MLETLFSFLISKNRVKFRYFELFLVKKSILAILAYILLKIDIFRSAMFLLPHCDVICWPIFMILVSMERGDPTLYFWGIKNYTFGRFNFKITGGGNHPLRKTCHKKGSGRRGLIAIMTATYIGIALWVSAVNTKLVFAMASWNLMSRPYCILYKDIK